MKKNKILLVCSLVLGVPSVVMGIEQARNATQANADIIEKSFTVAFKQHSSDSTSAYTTSKKISDIVSSGAEYLDSIKATSKAYDGEHGIKLGSSKAIGEITFNLNQSYTISRIEAFCYKYGSDTGKICIQGNQINETLTADGVNCVYSYTSPASENTVSFSTSTKRAYISSFKVFYQEVTAESAINTNFYLNDGTEDLYYTATTEKGQNVAFPDNPNRDRYTFLGWFTEKENGSKIDSLSASVDTNLYAHWEAITYYTVMFEVDGGTAINDIEVESGSKLDSKDLVTTKDNFKLNGWAKEDGTLWNFETDTVTSDMILTAVWRKPVNHKYEKVTSDQIDWSGKYLIVYETDSVCFDGSLVESETNGTSLDSSNNTQKVTIADGKIVGELDDYLFTVSAIENGYSITSASGYSIGKTSSSSNGMDISDTNAYLNTIKYENNKLSILSDSNCKLSYNATSGQNRFRYYKPSSTQEDIQLYKLVEENIDETKLVASYSAFTTDTLDGIRFVGSVNNQYYNDVSKFGFNITLKENNITKRHESAALYDTLNDTAENIAFYNEDEVFTKEGFLSFGLMLTDIPADMNATIEFYSYAVINEVEYHSTTYTINIVNGSI